MSIGDQEEAPKEKLKKRRGDDEEEKLIKTDVGKRHKKDKLETKGETRVKVGFTT